MRALTFILCGLAVATSGCAVTSLVVYKLSPDFPDDAATEAFTLPGLSQPVKVVFDAWGVPHLEAESLVDLARATGFVQGRARFFQMDLMRRLARGEVSALVGRQPFLSETTVDYDRTMRGWLIDERSRVDLAQLDPEQAQVLLAFAEGVNAAVKRHLPLEYRLLGVEPRPWEPSDTLAVGLLNVWSVSHNWSQEATRLLLAMSVGLERGEQIYPNLPPSTGRTLADGGVLGPLPPAVAPELAGLFPVVGARPHPPAALDGGLASHGGLGLDLLATLGASNAWVVSGKHTASGRPMLANDPHLTHFLPSVMMQLHLKAPDLDVIGVTVPGIPWVLAGHNQHLAWGITSTVADVIDLVIEKVDPNHPGQVVTGDGAPCLISEREVRIQVRDGSELLDEVVKLRRTCHGPVFNDLYPRLFPEGSPLVSIRWNTEKLGDSMAVLLAIDRAQSVKQLGEVVAELPATYNTWTVADTQGHIGVFVSGSVPVHEQSLGTFPVPGWVKKYEWARWAKGEELPWTIDPESGILAHANNLMVEPGAKGFVTLNVDAAPGYRHDRIVELLAATPKHDDATFRRIQADIFSPRAKRLLPRLLDDLGDDAELTPKARLAVELLKNWNLEASAEMPAPTIFFATWRAAIRHALRDELTEEAIRFFLAQRYSTSTSDQWFEQPHHPVWDDTATPLIEDRTQVVRAALEAAVLGLWTELGEDVSSWRWGRVHWHKPTHAFGNNALLDGTVNLQRHPVGGELDSVWKSHFDVSNERAPFKVVAGPVYRMVTDLADLKNESYWIVDTGSSGWPTATHYGDQFERWRRGEMIPMWTDPKRLKGALHGTLTLMPRSLP